MVSSESSIGRRDIPTTREQIIILQYHKPGSRLLTSGIYLLFTCLRNSSCEKSLTAHVKNSGSILPRQTAHSQGYLRFAGCCHISPKLKLGMVHRIYRWVTGYNFQIKLYVFSEYRFCLCKQ